MQRLSQIVARGSEETTLGGVRPFSNVFFFGQFCRGFVYSDGELLPAFTKRLSEFSQFCDLAS